MAVQRDSDDHTYVQAWPSGGAVVVTALDGQKLDLDVARRVANSVERAEAPDLHEQATEISARLAAWPTVAAADMPAGRVEVHEQGDADAVCVTPTGSVKTCLFAFDVLQQAASLASNSFLDGDRWFIGSVTGHAPLTFTSDDQRVLPAAQATVSAGGRTYRMGIAEIPADVTSVSVAAGSGGTASSSGALPHPDF
jgi:hypothetical protein